MKFCPDCNNCLYIQESSSSSDDSGNLENYCRNCGYSEKRADNKIETFQFEYEAAYKNIVPEEIVNDLTYPRTKAVECPNGSCVSRTNNQREVLFFKQKGNLKLTYICANCKTMWKN
jgi:DNA-directed RNA polymerase subunit M/transcription elongation factor TFIIS